MTRRARATSPHLGFALALLSAATGCAPRETCEPDPAVFEADILPRIERYCGTCHGDEPNFGAPVSLLSVEDLLASRPGARRLVDRIAERVADGSMPPVGMPRLPEEDADAIAAWASCGAVDTEPSVGLVSTAPPFLAPRRGPSDAETMDLLADHPVPPDLRNEYWCFVFDVDLPAERFVRRFEMVFGETRVLHHVILSRDTERRLSPGTFQCNGGAAITAGTEYLYTWAPGQSALEFPEGGLRVAPGERFVLQIHYNNGASLPDVRDRSGVRLFLGPTEGTEYGMFAVGPSDFVLPPRTTTTVAGRCTVRTPMTLLAGMPHMHLLGSTFEQTVVRGTTRTDLVSLSGWEFESQLFYALPRTLSPGDVIETRCTYDNPSADEVVFGEDTSDEMCNDFIYVTPPPISLYCDEGSPDRPTDVAYLPSACLTGGAADPPLSRGAWTRTDAPPSLTTGPAPDGLYVLESAEVFGTGGATPVGAIDFTASYVLARGQVVIDSGSLTLDLSSDTVVLLDGGMRFGRADHQSFTVPFDASTTPLTASPSCPADADTQTLDWGIEGDVLTVGFVVSDVPGMTIWPRYRFRRAP